MRLTIVYARRGQLLIRTSCWTEHGVWVQQGPCASMPENASLHEVGKAVLHALSESKQIPHPTKWGGGFNEVLRAAGVRSWSAFVKEAHSVEVDQLDDESFSVSPSRNRGAKEGFEALPERGILLPRAASAEEIGDAVRTCLARSAELSKS